MNLFRKILAAWIIFYCCALVVAQDKPRQDERLRTVEFNGLRLTTVLANLAADFQVTIGLEADPRKPESTVELHLRGVVFREILDGIVVAEPLYKWRDNNGAIDVLPVGGGLLDARIDSLPLQDINRGIAVSRLFGLPEVRELMNANHLKPRNNPGHSDSMRDEKLSFDLRSVTIRQALNQIAHESGVNFWVFRTYPDGTYEIKMGCC